MRISCNWLKVAVTLLAREGDVWGFVSCTVTLSEWSICETVYVQQENSMA